MHFTQADYVLLSGHGTLIGTVSYNTLISERILFIDFPSVSKHIATPLFYNVATTTDIINNITG